MCLSYLYMTIVTFSGESGEAVFTSMEEKAAADRSTSEYGFNMVNSDKISMDRTIPDTRMDEYDFKNSHSLIEADQILLWQYMYC